MHQTHLHFRPAHQGAGEESCTRCWRGTRTQSSRKDLGGGHTTKRPECFMQRTASASVLNLANKASQSSGASPSSATPSCSASPLSVSNQVDNACTSGLKHVRCVAVLQGKQSPSLARTHAHARADKTLAHATTQSGRAHPWVC